MATFKSVIEGLQILAKYEDKGEDAFILGADYHTIKGGYGNDITEEDKEQLEELGWLDSKEECCWIIFAEG